MRHVLIIEDHHATAKALADMAVHAGASSVAIMADETRAIAAAREHAPRIILSDVDLGPGGRGPDAVAAIHAEVGPVPTIFITGDPGDAAGSARATAILTKPVTARRVESVLADVMATCPDPRRFGGIIGTRSKPSYGAERGVARSSRLPDPIKGDGHTQPSRGAKHDIVSSTRRENTQPDKTRPHLLRGSQRFPTSLRAVLEVGRERHEVTIADISASGARVRCVSAIPLHATVALEAGSERIAGHVVWRTADCAGLHFSRTVAPLEIVRQSDPALRAIFGRPPTSLNSN